MLRGKTPSVRILRHSNLLIAGVLLVGAPIAAAGTTTFSSIGSIDTFIAPATAVYTITAVGAGGGGAVAGGGRGASVTDTFSLPAGDTINILVGGQGDVGSDGPGGGGGGTFVVQLVPSIIGNLS